LWFVCKHLSEEEKVTITCPYMSVIVHILKRFTTMKNKTAYRKCKIFRE